MMKHVHFIGIGGSGLSAIARILVESGYEVSGSDRVMSALASDLAKAGVQVFIGHNPENVRGADLVIRSSAIKEDNFEVMAARLAGIPVLKRADFLGEWMAGGNGIAIAGTHGKTTTTAMVAWVLTCLQQDPSYIIGGISLNLAKNAHVGKGQAFVIEADEYDGMFLGLKPQNIIVTNVEHDHPDCYPTPEEYYQAFASFARLLRPGGSFFACVDDPGAKRLAEEIEPTTRVFSYGFSENARYQARNAEPNDLGGFTYQAFSCEGQSETSLGKYALQVPGLHNVRNSLSVVALIDQLGLSLSGAAEALQQYKGTGRRFEVLGTAMGVTIIDDYAHHPTEIRATLNAARARFPKRTLWVVWQPHTFSRTQTLQNEFVTSFENADHVLVTEVYAAREKENPFSAAQIVAQMSHPDARFTPTLEKTTSLLLDQLKSGDVLLVLSAGDADQVSARVLAALRQKEMNHD